MPAEKGSSVAPRGVLAVLLLEVPLDRCFVAHVCFGGIRSRMTPPAALAKQIPALVELHFNAIQLLARLCCGVVRQSFAQLMFFVDEPLDIAEDILIIHLSTIIWRGGSTQKLHC